MIGDILQPTHLLFVLVIALLVLGPKRLPEVGKSLGKGLRDFRSALSTEEPERRDEALTPAATTAAPPQPAPPAPTDAVVEAAPAVPVAPAAPAAPVSPAPQPATETVEHTS